MSNIAPLSLLTYFPEVTQGTPPANAAAWISSGVRIRHIAASLDMSGIEREQLVDERNQTRVKGTQARVEGLDNPEFPFAVYAHGTGETTADGDQVATDAPGYQLGFLLGHALGGITRTRSGTIADGSSTTSVLAVTDATDWTVGDFIAVQFATPPTGYAATTAWPRRVIARDSVSSPNTITVDQVLPATPAAADLIHGCIVTYPDEDIISDSTGASGRTLSWLVQKGLPGAGSTVRESYEFRGCVATLQTFSMERGQLKQFAFQVMAGSHADPTDAPWPTAWSANAELGLAPLSIGPLTECWFVTEGATTNTNIQINAFSCEPGVPRVRVETITSSAVNMQGTYGYSTAPAETLLTVEITPYRISEWTDQTAGTYKTLRWARLGPAGSGLAVHFPKLSHVKTPGRTENNTTTAVGVQFKAHEEDSLGTTTELQQAALCIIQW
jgi:hypothetical protein